MICPYCGALDSLRTRDGVRFTCEDCGEICTEAELTAHLRVVKTLTLDEPDTEDEVWNGVEAL